MLLVFLKPSLSAWPYLGQVQRESTSSIIIIIDTFQEQLQNNYICNTGRWTSKAFSLLIYIYVSTLLLLLLLGNGVSPIEKWSRKTRFPVSHVTPSRDVLNSFFFKWVQQFNYFYIKYFQTIRHTPLFIKQGILNFITAFLLCVSILTTSFHSKTCSIWFAVGLFFLQFFLLLSAPLFNVFFYPAKGHTP